ncbi:cation-binding protein [Nocardiopsis terrae]|uniref:Deazaflavin-dependent oxidoreductase (Nitroreductase family) n=1 Tax=Nocardiopsis terrae TaxID=372655 RepID=A0ABR9HKM8_9ACTN|nr:deazaflavin-dependent oxidoreductase (nitroreductase family) [Nocardiopsis terrae]GHC95160.1 cation-binding protein [Nocardiopsis terrae]
MTENDQNKPENENPDDETVAVATTGGGRAEEGERTPAPAPHPRPEPVVSPWNEPVVEEFRANGGRVGGVFEGGDLLLLTTTGARSGREHTTPLGFLRIDGRVYVVGSAGGSPRHPDWYRNLLAHPMALVEMSNDDSHEAVAVPVEGAERDRVFQEIVRREPGFGEYQEQVERRLPVVELQRSDLSGPAEVDNLADKLFQIHAWLRGQLVHVRREAELYLAGRESAGAAHPMGLNLRIRQHCLAFCESLHFHHTSEDTAFPQLAEGFPHLREPVERLIREHRAVDRLRGELEGLLTGLETADPVRFMAELDRLTEELQAHLEFEEGALIPTLAEIPFPPPGPAQ